MCDRAALPSPAVTPGLPHVHTRSFPGTRQHVGQARKFIAAVLDECPHADDAVLLISELAANACAHSASGTLGGTFTVRAEIRPGAYVHAEVEDQGSPWDGNITTAQCPHGLYLLRQLSAHCGTQRGQHGWITWFTITTLASPANR